MSTRFLRPAIGGLRGCCTKSPAILPALRRLRRRRFMRLHRKPPPARINIEGWLYRTGFRLALDHLKKERRRARYEAVAAVFGLAARPANTPDVALELAEERRRLRRALGALKADQFALILLRSEGCTYDELATKVQLNPASVGKLLARAEEAFRKEYVKRYGTS